MFLSLLKNWARRALISVSFFFVLVPVLLLCGGRGVLVAAELSLIIYPLGSKFKRKSSGVKGTWKETEWGDKSLNFFSPTCFMNIKNLWR